MLFHDVATIAQAEVWLKYYETRYPKGRPWPNGKGVYNASFVLCSTEDEIEYTIIK